jgi:hypothetical protein
MGHSPAAVMFLYSPSAEHAAARQQRLLECTKTSMHYEKPMSIHELALSEPPPESDLPMSVGFLSPSRHVGSIEALVFIARPNFVHENVCLEEDRAIILALLRNRVIDAVNFCFGLPKKKPGFFSKYEPHTTEGYRPFVALELLWQAFYPKREQLTEPVTLLLRERWDELQGDDCSVIVQHHQRKAFLASCTSLPYFSDVSVLLAKAAA